MEGNWNGASPTVGNKFQYNGKELNTDFDLNWNDYGARNYDPAIGRFTTADPMADFRNRVSPYQYVQNNPINRIDPTGMVDQSTAEKRAAMAQAVSENEKWMNSTRKDGGYWAAAKESMTIHLSSDKRKIKDFEGDDHEITQADIKGGAQTEVTTGHEEMLSYGTQCVVDSRAIFTSGCGCGGPGEPPCDALDPSTLGKNLFWMTYPGGTNPMKFNGLPDYSYNPGYRNLFEYPAIGHDRAYDILGIKGGSGLFLNVKAIGADWRFVKEEFNIAKRYFDSTGII